MDYKEFNLYLSRLIHTLIRLGIVPADDEGVHYKMHASLFEYWHPIMDKREKELYKTNGPECPPK